MVTFALCVDREVVAVQMEDISSTLAQYHEARKKRNELERKMRDLGMGNLIQDH